MAGISHPLKQIGATIAVAKAGTTAAVIPGGGVVLVTNTDTTPGAFAMLATGQTDNGEGIPIPVGGQLLVVTPPAGVTYSATGAALSVTPVEIMRI